MSDHGCTPSSRGRGVRRSKYNPTPGKMNGQQQQQQMMWQRREQRPSISITSTENGTDNKQRATSSPSPANNVGNNSQRNGDNPTNLDRFLEFTTPVVPARHFTTTIIRGPRDRKIEIKHPPYFVLKDLWDSFEEWSAMGIGVPLKLYESDSVTQYSVTQYYVPYLSAIQLYIDPSTPPTQRTPVQGARSHTDVGNENIAGLYRQLQGLTSDETDIRNPLGLPVFEYFEHEQPYNREPLFGRVSALAETQFPALMTYRSCDLSPSSWISVAWYPIYMIPDGLQKVDTCFLTYHCLSTQGTSADGLPFHGFKIREFRCSEMSSKLPLHTFGLAFYKFRISLWITAEVIESSKLNSLFQESKSWLRRLEVLHPDFMFFESHT